jgi:hypothetical protein
MSASGEPKEVSGISMCERDINFPCILRGALVPCFAHGEAERGTSARRRSRRPSQRKIVPTLSRLLCYFVIFGPLFGHPPHAADRSKGRTEGPQVSQQEYSLGSMVYWFLLASYTHPSGRSSVPTFGPPLVAVLMECHGITYPMVPTAFKFDSLSDIRTSGHPDRQHEQNVGHMHTGRQRNSSHNAYIRFQGGTAFGQHNRRAST